MKKRARQVDVARLAGVSPATVSLVLNDRISGNVRIPEETRQRVLDAATQLGYVADPIARSLAGGQNRLLGVFTYEALFPIQTQDFYYPFLLGIEEAATDLDYNLLLFTGGADGAGRRSIYDNGINRLRLADGAVLLGHEKEKDELLSLRAEGYPFVFVGRRAIPDGEIAYVGADYTQATIKLMQFLFAHGHRRIAYLHNAQRNESSLDRLTGYCRAHETQGIPLRPDWMRPVEIGDVTPDFVADFVEQEVTAFAVEHDSVATALLEATAALHLDVPADLSLVMLGDPLTAGPVPARLTRFAIPRREMGAGAVQLLVRILNGSDPTPQQQMLTCSLVPGSTVALART